MIDHATGLVIGETATVGTNCSFLHGVTLGATGKHKDIRHPQIGNGVLIGCSTAVLGHIHVGDNCKIGSGSIVLKHIPAGCTAVGNPARVIGKSSSPGPAAEQMDVGLQDVIMQDGTSFMKMWNLWADPSNI
jgi:serine O-acetyltransferase